ncbi:MAG: hypothetical protein ACKOW1_04370 [Novosphingobium sp.]
MDEPPIERTTEQVRAGSTPGIVRWVLLISLILLLLAFGLVLALSMRNDRAPSAKATPQPAPETSA